MKNSICFVFTIFLAMLLFTASAFGFQTIPNLTDFAKLNLKIKDMKITDEISSGNKTLSAQENERLIVITLEGEIPFECIYSISDADFNAVCEIEKTFSIGNMQGKYCEVVRASAIEINSVWGIPEENENIQLACPSKPGPVTLKIAFVLPKYIDNFSISYPTLIQEKVIIPKDTSQKNTSGK